MKHIKIAAGLAHVDYGHIADIVKEASDAGADYIHSDAADMHDLRNMKLMGGWQVIQGMRPFTEKPIECHIYTESMDIMFIDQIHQAGANMLIIPAEHFIGAQLAYIINWCRERNLKVGLTLGCYTPLCFVEESIYDIDRLHIVTHGVDETDGHDNWGWRRSAVDLVKRARKMIDEKNPKCELAIDGGLRSDNLEPLIECNPDVVVLSSAIFKDPEGITAGVKRCRQSIDAAAEKFNLE
ncbi:pentose-5-phosphate 3-epimerase [Faecalicoccus pleomorphus]|uniref:Pentose-5-phosphate 3-epimerase n=1 Tax=Faecalicoccus pleomorphus TaxID=1323 RepID=A0A3E3DVX9_9FIRM|nr:MULTISPECIES: pentose-5-phosphate 3-epimerase [Faecalicoccus]MCI6380632.1 pentose-5-phosphate 3-epimerase [Erysipelotrichaceae bacterium]MDB7980818.1 pentose-5-phosphate 3-epimerase [Faecalicoccus pleomorphus]MDB7983006.1 pentose-5-phosphate 3-epimerase [Faecalicoccus pleomorphus]MDB7988949.1 pentose-5-phosphate 3-epimerase [Faecalicoccus pleomorphus]MDB7993321.1 pentose-5-phosphate 3-epimerase [Faecalicoccus pleomorphus]